jgi:hypothetical protein
MIFNKRYLINSVSFEKYFIAKFMKSKSYSLSYLTLFLLSIILFSCTQSENYNRNNIHNIGKDEFLKEDKKDERGDYSKKDFSKCLKDLEKFVKDNPDNQEGHYYLGYVYTRYALPDGSDMLNINFEYNIKASNEFKKVLDINPEFEGENYILSPYSKLSAIWGSAALEFAFTGKSDSALWAFRKGKELGGYSKTVLDNSRNVLACCEKDAILFSTGDMDAFPVWYLQYVENYRKDVTLINLSLLNTVWYVKSLKDSYPFGFNKIKISFTDEQIDKLNAIKWKSQIVSMPVPKNIISKYNVQDTAILNSGIMQWKMPPTMISGKISAIKVQDIILKDILSENNWERPVYFPFFIEDVSCLGLNDYFQLNGILFKLTPLKSKKAFDAIDEDAAKINFFNDYMSGENIYQTGFIWNIYEDAAMSINKDLFIFPELYRVSSLYFAYHYYLNNASYCQIILTKLDEKIPPEKYIPYIQTYDLFKKIYTDLNKKEEINKLNYKIENAVLKKIELKKINRNDFEPVLTLLHIYDISKEYNKALKILYEMKNEFPENTLFIDRTKYFKEKAGKN